MAKFFDFEQDYIGLEPNKIDNMLSMYGLNSYTKAPSGLSTSTIADIMLSPSVLLMIIAGILCFFGMNIGAGIFTLLIAGLYVFSQFYFRKRSDARLDEIELSTAVKFRVIRGGKLEFVEKEFIVPDDLIVVQAGERVPADAFILESRDLTIDESVFTGDKRPAAKYTGDTSKNGINPSFVYSGTTVVSGVAVCKVSSTGVDTKLFQLRGQIKERHPYNTELEKFVRANVPICSAVGVVLTLILMILKISNNAGIVPSAISGITVGLCFVPAGISSVIRLYYTLGAMKIIKDGAMMKSFADIEKINSMSVLCIEKEGAISKNTLDVRGIYAQSEELLYKVAALAFEKNSTDPAERALMVKAAFFDENINDIYKDYVFVERIPDLGNSISGAIWEVGGDKICCMKGSPEQILPICKMSDNALFEAKQKYESYYAKGCSVMAIACVDAASYQADATAGFSYTFIGFIAFSAPLRDSVSNAVKTCRRAGVRIVMFTEEMPGTAASTGTMIGLSVNNVVTGSQIEKAIKSGDDTDIKADIYAKVTPEQKVYIINKLKEKGDTVAMTGTRAGDAEALEAADVGITIAQQASGSTYEASDIVMNDDNLLTIADMIASARQIHRNIKRAVSVLFSGYAAMILVTVINMFCSANLMLTPPLIALLTMVILPMLSSVYIHDNADMRQNMPRSGFVAERKINFRYVGKAALVGICAGASAVASYLFMYTDQNTGFARSTAFISLIVCMTAFVIIRFSDETPFRTFLSSPLITKIITGSFIVLSFLLVFIPGINKSFGFTAIDFPAVLIAIATGILPPGVYLFAKRFFKASDFE